MTPPTLRLWQPPARETIDAIADVLMAHWRAAKSQERLFWPEATDWLHRQAVRLASAPLFGPRYAPSLVRTSER
jgi:hypothetical protein